MKTDNPLPNPTLISAIYNGFFAMPFRPLRDFRKGVDAMPALASWAGNRPLTMTAPR